MGAKIENFGPHDAEFVFTSSTMCFLVLRTDFIHGLLGVGLPRVPSYQ